MLQTLRIIIVLLLYSFVSAPQGTTEDKLETKTKTLNVLFVGNSYTARHNLATVVKAIAEAGDPALNFNPTQVIYGGRTLKDHWRLGTQHVLNQHQVSRNEITATISQLEKASEKASDFKYTSAGLKRMRELLKQFDDGTLDRGKWDLIVLQSYRDDLDGEDSLYMQFAPKFSALAKSQGARVLLYETTPTTQNQLPLVESQDPQPILLKSEHIGKLADKLNASVAPMAYVALQAQTKDPNITLRFLNDAHLNQTMAYLTACTIYAAIFDRSPEGLSIDSVTDIRYLNNDRATNQDRDGQPIKKEFTQQQRELLQSTAWKALKEFETKFRVAR